MNCQKKISPIPEGSPNGFTGHAQIEGDFYPNRNALFWHLPPKKDVVPQHQATPSKPRL